MVDLNRTDLKDLLKSLDSYDPIELISTASSLLTLPKLLCNSLRIEAFIHLSVAAAKGKRPISRKVLDNLLQAIPTSISLLEDPAEDVFCSCIITPVGEARVLNGIWEGNDFYIQSLLDVITNTNLPNELHDSRESILALLKISEEIARRSQLDRNCLDSTSDKKRIRLPQASDLVSIRSRVVFTEDDLWDLGIDPNLLDPFIFCGNRHQLINEAVGNSSLERYPIIWMADKYLVALPNSIGIALRKYFIEKCQKEDLLNGFGNVLMRYQFEQIRSNLSRSLNSDLERLNVKLDKPNIKNLPPLTSVLMKLSHSDYLHLVLFRQNLGEILSEGFDSHHSWSDEEQIAIDSYIKEIFETCSTQKAFRKGKTIFLCGGLGRNEIIDIPEISPYWKFTCINLADFYLLSNSKSDLKEFLFCLEQEDWLLDTGIDVFNVNGSVNFYGFWQENRYACLPLELEAKTGNMFAIYTHHIGYVRERLKRFVDKHTSYDPLNNCVVVIKLSQDSFFESRKDLPLYASETHVVQGILNALIELPFANIWFSIADKSESISKDQLYEWWSGISALLAGVFLDGSKEVVSKNFSNVQIVLDCSGLDLTALPHETDNPEKELHTEIYGAGVFITLQKHFLHNFSQQENIGERLLILEMVKAVEKALFRQGVNTKNSIYIQAEKVLENSALRLIHLYSTLNHAEYLLETGRAAPIFCDGKRIIFYKLQIANQLGKIDRAVYGVADCCKELNSLVLSIFHLIKAQLKLLSKKNTLLRLSEHLKNIEQDRSQWRRTAKAVEAIHGAKEDVISVAGSRESERSLASMCIRGLMEIAVCESSSSEGFNPSIFLLDELLGLCSALISIATDSDAIHSGLIEPSIKFHGSGAYTLLADPINEVLIPYTRSFQESQFKKSVESYGSLYEELEQPDRRDLRDVYSQAFITAFEAETNITLDHSIEIFASMVDLLVDKSVTESSFQTAEVFKYISSEKPISHETWVNFLAYFSISEREGGYANRPQNCQTRDIQLWKHKRKLSCLVKPIFKLSEEEIFISLQLLKVAIGYFYDKAESAEFPPNFFSSPEMRRYQGEVVNRKGTEFEVDVGNTFESKGWCVNLNIFMSTLGAPERLGEVDLVAFKGDKLIIVECKCLQMAKTVPEIADICDRFKGDSDDSLDRHIKRFNWITENQDKLIKYLKIQVPIKKLDQLVVTQAQMPFKFLSGLPISPTKIVSHSEVPKTLALYS